MSAESTELMGGFAIPSFLKQRRLGLQYATFGLRLSRENGRTPWRPARTPSSPSASRPS